MIWDPVLPNPGSRPLEWLSALYANPWNGWFNIKADASRDELRDVLASNPGIVPDQFPQPAIQPTSGHQVLIVNLFGVDKGNSSGQIFNNTFSQSVKSSPEVFLSYRYRSDSWSISYPFQRHLMPIDMQGRGIYLIGLHLFGPFVIELGSVVAPRVEVFGFDLIRTVAQSVSGSLSSGCEVIAYWVGRSLEGFVPSGMVTILRSKVNPSCKASVQIIMNWSLQALNVDSDISEGALFSTISIDRPEMSLNSSDRSSMKINSPSLPLGDEWELVRSHD